MLDESLLQHLRFDASHNPDASRRALYGAVVRALDAGEQILADTLVAASTRGLTARHLANLIAHAIEYLLISNAIKIGGRAYRTFSISDWQRLISKILRDQRLLTLFQRLLMQQTSQTNKYQRYCGANFVLAKVFGAQPLVIADMGCALNVGLLGLATGKPFLPVVDHTREESVNCSKLAQMEFGVGVDIADPRENEDWAIACSFYPSEADGIDEFRADLRALREEARNVGFMPGSFMDLSRVWAAQGYPLAHAVTACTVLYQLSEHGRRQFFEEVGLVLRDGGVLIISDFVDIYESRLRWAEPWEVGDKRYRTVVLRKTPAGFSLPAETLVWSSSRCREVWPGADY